MKDKNNNWYVVTGGPHSGKTTLLEALEKKGYKVQYESARILIEDQIRSGLTVPQIRKDELEFQRKVLKIKIDVESKFHTDQTIFFDRGIPDSLAYYKLLGAEKDEELQKALRNCNYKKVFLLEMMDYRPDTVRTETKEQAIMIHDYLKEAYTQLGFNIVNIPVSTLNERVNMIINNL